MSSIAIRTSDKRKRLMFASLELSKLTSNSLRSDICVSYKSRYRLNPLNLRTSSRSRTSNRCVLTGRRSGIYRTFKTTRMVFKTLAGSGLLPGVKKSSW